MKLQVPFIQLPLHFDASAIAAEVEALGEAAWRPHPQAFAGNWGLPLIAVGGDPDDDRTAGAMQPTPYLDRCPYTRDALASMGAIWGRTRFMRLDGNAEVTPHVDNNYYWRERVRVHIPVLTHAGVRFECGDEAVNMAAGECWIFDTWRLHRVLNSSETRRIHLVADTVGSSEFWQFVGSGRRPGDSSRPWVPQRMDAGMPVPPLLTESVNRAAVMSPWEIKDLLAFIFSEAHPHAAMPQLQAIASDFSREWRALWARYGESEAGQPAFRAQVSLFGEQLHAYKGVIALRNGIDITAAIRSLILMPAVRANDTSTEPTEPRDEAPAAPTRRAPSATSDPLFDRPVFVVCAPRSGSTMLFQALAEAPGLYTLGRENYAVLEGVQALHPRWRDFDSNRLDAGDASADVIATLRLRYFEELRDREGVAPPGSGPLRMMDKTPKNALRVPFLAKVFPEAQFVFLHRDPRQVLSSMIEAWESGRFTTYPGLPDWPGLPWSMLLVPGWRELKGLPVPEIVAAQWQRTMNVLLEDLETLPRERVDVVQYDALRQEPQATLARLCASLGLAWDRDVGAGLPLSRNTVSAPDPEKWRRHAGQIDRVWPQVEPTVQRLARFVAT